MKRKLLAFLAIVLCTGAMFTACKKSDTKDDSTPTNAQVATQTDDEAMLSKEMDDAASDVSTVIESDANFSGANAVLSPIVCDATVEVNRDSDPMTMTITFNGASCNASRVRTGQIVVSMAKGTEWKNQGAVVTVSYHNVKITRASDNKSVVLNGTHTLTNTTGKLLQDLATSGTIIHVIASTNMSISFDNGTERTWSVSKKRTYSWDNGAVLTVSGNRTEGNLTDVAEWGVNRFGKPFTVQFTQPLVYRQSCDFRLTAGEVKHTTEAYTATVTFGLDQAGAVTGCPGEGHYYYHLDWSGKNGAHLSIILPY